MLQVEGLVKSWDERCAVNSLSFEVGDGEIFALVGPNGSGKTTTIDMIAGLVEPDGGVVRVERNGARPGLAGQELSLYRDLTPRENLEFFGEMHGLNRRASSARADELLELFAFGENGNVLSSRLSGGWQRRLHVAIALVQGSRLVMLDEPTAGLDVDAKIDLWGTIRALRSGGTSFLITTHDLAEAERMCDRIGILHRGELVAEGTMSELRRHVPAERLAELESSDGGAVLRRCSEIGWPVRSYAGRTTALLPERLEISGVVDRLEGLPLDSVAVREVGLEHVWLEVTRETGTLAETRQRLRSSKPHPQ